MAPQQPGRGCPPPRLLRMDRRPKGETVWTTSWKYVKHFKRFQLFAPQRSIFDTIKVVNLFWIQKKGGDFGDCTPDAFLSTPLNITTNHSQNQVKIYMHTGVRVQRLVGKITLAPSLLWLPQSRRNNTKYFGRRILKWSFDFLLWFTIRIYTWRHQSQEK